MAALVAALLALLARLTAPATVVALEASAPAVRASEAVCVTDDAWCHPPPAPPGPPPGPCGEWFGLALAVGWPAGQWPTVARVMRCESNCDPGAHNRSGASGLLQIMPMWWRGRDPYDPAANLAMGLEVWRAQGWRAWSCYR